MKALAELLMVTILKVELNEVKTVFNVKPTKKEKTRAMSCIVLCCNSTCVLVTLMWGAEGSTNRSLGHIIRYFFYFSLLCYGGCLALGEQQRSM